jgi:prepilin-type N-terminal cleavage/methylation domain-containing protein
MMQSSGHLSRTLRLRNGFTLAELLIGSVLLAIAVVGAASLMVSTNLTNRRNELSDRHEALIDDDISRIQELARRYTWCTGAPRFTNTTCPGPGGIGTIASGSEDYYFPDLNSLNGATKIQSFVTACTTNTAGVTPVRTELINALITELPLAQLTAINNELVRTAAVPDGPAQAQRILITYANLANADGSPSARTTVTRVVSLSPPVADWCP